jgi:photosystem II stability/assembly factor-like uncharacterized protein
MKPSRTIVLWILVFCASQAMGQIFQWEKKLPGAGLGNPFAFNPSNDNTLFVSAGGAGVLDVSRDRGASWDTLGVVPGGGFIKAICVHPADSLLMLVGQERTSLPDRVLRSTDGGLSWTETLAGEFSYYGVPVESNPHHPDTVFTMMGSTVFRSTDFGATWSARSTAPGFNTWCDAALRPDSADVLYVGDNTSGIWKSADGGISFRHVYASQGEIPMIAVDEAEPAVAYATKFFGSGSGIIKTTDFGETWSELAAFQGTTQCWGVAVDRSDHRRVAMGTYTSDLARTGIYLSTDAGATWRRTLCGLNAPYSLNYGLLAMDSLHVFALQDEGIFRLGRFDLVAYPHGGVAGELRDPGTGQPVAGTLRLAETICESTAVVVRDVDSTGTFRFDSLLVSDGPLAASYGLQVDPAIPYARRSVLPLHVSGPETFLPISLRPADVFVVGEDSGGHEPFFEDALSSLGYTMSYWNTLERGAAPLSRGVEFARKTVIYYAAGTTSPLSQAESSNLVSCLASGCGLFLTGQDLLERNPSAEIFTISLGVGFGGNASALYNEGVAGDLLDGVTFFTNGSGADYPQSRDILTIGVPETKAIASYGSGGGAGIAGIRRDGTPSTGNAIFLGFGFESINPADKRRLVMDRILRYLGESGTSVEPAERRPAQFRLGQNYPNPFNPSTTITFELAARARVFLTVYDLLGRVAAAPLGGVVLAEGEQSVVVNAGALPSGLYVYRLRVDGPGGPAAESRKMLLVR